MIDADHGTSTYLHKFFKRGIIPHFINDTVLSDRIVRDVLHILLTPVQRSIKDRSRNAVYDWVLVLLDSMETVKQLAVL